MHDEIVDALARTARPPSDEVGPALARPLVVTLVPIGVAVIAAKIHGDYSALVSPPSPVLLLAPAISYIVMRRVTTSTVDAGVTAALSALVAMLAACVIALLMMFAAAVECLGPNGGCLPW